MKIPSIVNVNTTFVTEMHARIHCYLYLMASLKIIEIRNYKQYIMINRGQLKHLFEFKKTYMYVHLVEMIIVLNACDVYFIHRSLK